MQVELIEALKDIALESIKILGPAIVAAYVAYKTASAQFKLRLAELEKGNQFKASQIMFELHKQWYEDVSLGYKSIIENLAQLNGMIEGGKGMDDIEICSVKFIKMYVHKIPFSIKKLLKEFEPYKESYSLEYQELLEAKNKFESLEEPTASNHIDYVVELEYIYSTLATCSQVIIGEKMDEVLSKYTVNN